MRIEQSTVAMQATHRFVSECEVCYDSETSFRTLFDKMDSPAVAATNGRENREKRILMMLEKLIARMLDLISGKGSAQVSDLREVLKTDDVPLNDAAETPTARLGIDWKISVTERVREEESTSFKAKGKISTGDGRTLDFALELGMCREFECLRQQTESGTIELRDPLVVNFDGKAAELSGKRFEFDLDSDGRTEAIPGLAGSSGFLAIDLNADGRIGNGSELFGARSGNGFADLMAFDRDGNHWLDESDPAFEALRIWRNDAAGHDTLKTLREEGIGALYLGSEETSFQLTDEECRLLAQIRASGVYLREDGVAGSMQQVDLAV